MIATFCPHCGVPLQHHAAVPAKGVVARGQLEENLRPRVAKLRQASSTMLDEAADDPGLRFVLIAAVHFIFTVALLVFSKLLH